METDTLLKIISQLTGLGGLQDKGRVRVETITPDGSPRLLFRLSGHDLPGLIAVAPSGDEVNGLAEAKSFSAIASHLAECGVPVPRLYGFDEVTGLLVCEDLGDTRLYEAVTGGGVPERVQLALYEQTVTTLAHMQVGAREGFQQSWCWDSAQYDQELMLERESGYFLQAFCKDFLGFFPPTEPLLRDFKLLARAAASAPPCFFLHRDFQSRNIMVKGGEVFFIDFQGGRMGPLAYDLASLLIDPYVGLDSAMQQQLMDVYLEKLKELTPYDLDRFRREYVYLALQRNLQILGAFAFLGTVRGKPFFRQFIAPALVSLRELLAKPEAGGYAALREVAAQCSERLARRGHE